MGANVSSLSKKIATELEQTFKTKVSVAAHAECNAELGNIVIGGTNCMVTIKQDCRAAARGDVDLAVDAVAKVLDEASKEQKADFMQVHLRVIIFV